MSILTQYGPVDRRDAPCEEMVNSYRTPCRIPWIGEMRPHCSMCSCYVPERTSTTERTNAWVSRMGVVTGATFD